MTKQPVSNLDEHTISLIYSLKIKTEKYKALAEAGEELLKENVEEWECLWGPKHKDFINGRCGHCGENPKGD